MNEEVLEKILRRLRGPTWTGPSWVTAKRATRYDVKTQDSVRSSVAVEDKSECREENAETVSESASPFIDASGNLVIPFSAPSKYHWWNGGQAVLETLAELRANDETMTRYMGPNWKN
jgi:hypothetical protein